MIKGKPFVLDGLDGYQFEELVAKIMKKKGYEKIKVTSKSRDGGKDITMENFEGDIILVECKHQSFVGRPIIQKLQGAMNHEETQYKDKNVKGIVVTSGNFSQEAIDYNKEIGQEIELIDGKKLKELCRELNLVILNGKVQILTNKSFKDILEKEVKELTAKEFLKIYGSKSHTISMKPQKNFLPSVFIKYKINFNTHTSVGCVDSYSNSGDMVIDGSTGKILDKGVINFFFSGKMETEEIKEKDENKKISFEFTENDVEDHALEIITEEHTHNVFYRGNNNVSYSKSCIPKKRDIDIKQFLPLYLPLWTNDLKIMNMNYKQKFYNKGNARFYLLDELKKCKICGREEEHSEDLSICPECGRIVCSKDRKIDYLDKETPICDIHAKPFKLWLQTKYFANRENLAKYKELWKSKNLFQKLYEDKIAFSFVICGVLVLFFFIISRF